MVLGIFHLAKGGRSLSNDFFLHGEWNTVTRKDCGPCNIVLINCSTHLNFSAGCVSGYNNSLDYTSFPLTLCDSKTWNYLAFWDCFALPSALKVAILSMQHNFHRNYLC